MTVEDISGESLPRAPVLAYLSNISTPTRVRIVVARVVLVFAILNLLVAALTLALAVWDVWKIAHELAAGRVFWWGPGRPPPGLALGPGSPTLSDYLEALRIGPGITALVYLSLFLTPGTAFLFLSGLIRRGGKIASILALFYFVPLMVLSLLATPMFASAILVDALGLAGRPHPIMYLWLLVIPAGVFIVLLLQDLCGFLRWIARNPMVDKPPVPFLPAP